MSGMTRPLRFVVAGPDRSVLLVRAVRGRPTAHGPTEEDGRVRPGRDGGRRSSPLTRNASCSVLSRIAGEVYGMLA